VYLAFEGAGHPFRTKTRDISRNGFYCLLSQLIQPGKQLACDIAVPAYNSQNPCDVVYLRCRVQAVRVEKIGAGADFGSAFRIEDYCVIHDPRESPQLALAEFVTSEK